MNLPEILTAERLDDAATLLHRYYTEELSTGAVRTGARFDHLSGGGDAADVVNRITADDLLALALLSVDVKGPAVVGLLETHSAEITQLLEQIPTNIDMAAVDSKDFDSVYGKGSPAAKLWDLIRGEKGNQWKMGQTKTSKLLARKRPRLIPIWDSVVAKATGVGSTLTQWEEWHQLLTADGGQLALHLEAIQAKADLPAPVSALRAMDVILWMDER